MRQHDVVLTPILAYVRALAAFAGVRRLVVLLAIMLAGALLESTGLLLLLPILQALDSAGTASLTLPGGVRWSLPLDGWLVLFGLFVAGRAFVVRLRDVRIAALRVGFMADLRTRFHDAVAGAEWRFLSLAPQAELFRLMTSAINDIGFGTYLLLQLAVHLVMASASLVVAFYLAPVLTLAALVAGGALWALQRRSLRRAHRLGQDYAAGDQAVFDGASEFFGGLKLIKSAGAESLHQARFNDQVEAIGRTQVAFFRNQSAARALQMLVSGVLAIALIYFSARVLRLPKADLLLSLLVLARLLPIAGELHYGLQEILHMLPTFSLQQDWLHRCRKAAEPTPYQGPVGPRTVAFEHAIQLEDVCYRHRPDAAPALYHVNLSIPARCTTALVGVSGAGKTTLADVILGLLLPEAGRVLVDGQVLTADQRLDWRRSAGYVPQEAFLFPGSVRDNLLWANPPADEAALWHALQQAAAADFVARLPQGLGTPVGERGMQISGGERQRLALARVLLRRPRLLVLDEATSHLDNESERAIQHALESLHGTLTVIVIAHRLSTIRQADQIVVLEQGRVVEQGDWASLCHRGGRFSAMLGGAAETPSP